MILQLSRPDRPLPEKRMDFSVHTAAELLLFIR